MIDNWQARAWQLQEAIESEYFQHVEWCGVSAVDGKSCACGFLQYRALLAVEPQESTMTVNWRARAKQAERERDEAILSLSQLAHARPYYDRLLPGVLKMWRDGVSCMSCGRTTTDPLSGHDGLCPVPALFAEHERAEQAEAEAGRLREALGDMLEARDDGIYRWAYYVDGVIRGDPAFGLERVAGCNYCDAETRGGERDDFPDGHHGPACSIMGRIPHEPDCPVVQARALLAATPAPAPAAPPTLDRETLGRLVRKTWVDYCHATGDHKPSHVAHWSAISEWDREADRRIGEAVQRAVLAQPAALPPDVAALVAADHFIKIALPSNLYAKARAVYGIQGEKDRMVEEMAELTVAIHHRMRGHDDTSVIEETADVLLMALQMREMLGREAVDVIADAKLLRLATRLGETAPAPTALAAAGDTEGGET